MYAGDLVTNTNQNVTFLRNPARDASTEIDAAYTNPAGLAFLKGDNKLFFSLNNQSAFQTRTITADFAPFAGFGGNATKAFEGKTSAPFVPNLQAAYKTGKWVFSANIGVVGGGGTLNFNKGLPSFESTVAIVPAFLNSVNTALSSMNPAVPNFGFGNYSLESQMKGTSMIIGAQLGATYTITEHLSAYLGVRYNYVNNSYKGYLNNVRLGMGGGMVSPSEVISDPTFSYIVSNTPTLAALPTLITAMTGNKELDCKQSGGGIAPIISLDYNWNGLNIGAKYEFKTGVNLKNKTTTNSTGVHDYEDGVTIPNDIPAMFAFGAKYDIISPLTVSVGYHHFFDSNAKMADNKQQNINGGVNEYLAGLEYRINKMFLVSCGAQITRPGLKDEYFSDLSFDVNSVSFGIGGAIDITKNIRVNLAYLITNYSDRTISSDDYGNINALTGGAISATHGTNVYARTNHCFGIGVDFSF